MQCDSTVPPCHQPALHWFSQAATVGMGAGFFWTCFPETLFEEIYIGPAPLKFVLFYATCILMALSVLFERRRSASVWLYISVGMMIYMTVIGLVWDNDRRFMMIDLSIFAGLVLGLIWARQRTPSEIGLAAYKLAWIVLVMLVINIIGLSLGVIPAATESVGRRYTFAFFEASRYLLILIPFLILVVPKTVPRRLRKSAKVLNIAIVLCLILAVLISATRSILIVLAFDLVLVSWLTVSRHNFVFRVLVIFLSAVAIHLAVSMILFRELSVLNRLELTDLLEEDRYVELQMMFEFLRGKHLTGTGFGSRFESCVVVAGETLAHCPHIASTTIWLKGGVFAFALLIVAPLVWGVTQIVAAFGRVGMNFRLRMLTSALAVGLAYLFSSTLSGGWDPFALFLYGASVATATKWSRRKTPEAEAAAQKTSLSIHQLAENAVPSVSFRSMGELKCEY